MKKSCLTCEFGKSEKQAKGYYCNNPTFSLHYTDPDGKSCWYADYPDICNSYRPKEPKMDKQTAIINHRHMWDWLMKNPMLGKDEYFQNFPQDCDVLNGCFACEYNKEHNEKFCLEDTCIFLWPGGQCEESESPFNQWQKTTDPSRCAELARQIRDLPEREEELIEIKVRAYGEPGIGKTYPAPIVRGTSEENKPSPPPRLTRTEAIAKTRKQWKWLAYNPSKQKSDYFDKIGMPLRDTPMFGCYLCKYTRDVLGFRFPECGKSCPLQWPGGCCSFEKSENIHTGLFEMWGRSEDDEKLHSSIAWLISHLPEKEE